MVDLTALRVDELAAVSANMLSQLAWTMTCAPSTVETARVATLALLVAPWPPWYLYGSACLDFGPAL